MDIWRDLFVSDAYKASCWHASAGVREQHRQWAMQLKLESFCVYILLILIIGADSVYSWSGILSSALLHICQIQPPLPSGFYKNPSLRFWFIYLYIFLALPPFHYQIPDLSCLIKSRTTTAEQWPNDVIWCAPTNTCYCKREKLGHEFDSCSYQWGIHKWQ